MIRKMLDRRVAPAVVFAVLFFSAVSAWAEVSPASPEADLDYTTGAGKKLGRGICNLAFGWIDLFKGIEEVGTENNFGAAITWGPIYGLGKAVTRTAAGAYEAATFPVAYPAHFEPVVQPEFILEDTRG